MNSSFSSWEELAFAEDASGILGGCVWPPRSYSCSFCRREFRSAQALGGHMNVHRRDRARLKQSSHAPAVSNNHLDDYDDAPPAIFSSAFYNIPNNPDFTPHLSLSSQVIRVSRSPDLAYTPGLCFQMTPERRLEKKRKDRLLSHSQPLSWSTSFVVAGKSGDRGLIKIYRDSKKSEVLDDENDSSSLRKDDCATKGLSVNLDLAVCQAPESNYASSNNGEEVASCKRRRVEAAKQLPSLFPKKTMSSSSIEMRSCLPHSEVFKLCSGAAEELDLELRLGNAPKVK